MDFNNVRKKIKYHHIWIKLFSGSRYILKSQ